MSKDKNTLETPPETLETSGENTESSENTLETVAVQSQGLLTAEEIRQLDRAGRKTYLEFMRGYTASLRAYDRGERAAVAKALSELDMAILAALQPVLDEAGDLGHRPFTLRHGGTGYTVVRSGAKRGGGGGTGVPRGPRHPIEVTQPIKDGKTPVGTQYRSYAAWAQAEGLKTGVGINAKGLILKKGGAAKEITSQ